MTVNRPLLTSAALLAGLAFSASASALDLSKIPSGTYTSDPTHSYVTFTYNHLGLSNPRLAFDDFDVTVELDVDDPSKSTVEVTIAVDSIVAGSDAWKGHLVGDKWFNTAEYPEITFVSTSVEAGDDETMTVMGDLTIKDTTQPVTLNVTVNAAQPHPQNNKPILGVDATTEVSRTAFGMGLAAPAVSDEVTISISTELDGG